MIEVNVFFALIFSAILVFGVTCECKLDS